MSYYLGIDTSNYTTSLSLFNDANNEVLSEKMLLPVKKGEKGIRQSDAVFHHTVQLPQLFENLFKNHNIRDIKAIGVSTKPSNQENSYMPCFLTGISVSKALSLAMNIPLYEFSHQDGHIVSALYSCNQLKFIKKDFIAFHISGGTSQVVLVHPDNDYFTTEIISDSLDLKAGQAIDRVGVMMGLQFPCGPEIEKLALSYNDNLQKNKIYRKNGFFSLSGIENQCKKMYDDGICNEQIAHHCLSSIYSAIKDTIIEIQNSYGKLPLVFSGGVMSNSLIRNMIKNEFDSYFAEPYFSSDNACGIAILSSICDKKE